MDYFDIEGNPLSVDWNTPEGVARLQELWSHEYRRVAQTYVGDVHVSTVFLPIDHGWGDGPPVLFETMVFGCDSESEFQWRYCTKEQALAGHEIVVEATRNRTLEELGDDLLP